MLMKQRLFRIVADDSALAGWREHKQLPWQRTCITRERFAVQPPSISSAGTMHQTTADHFEISSAPAKSRAERRDAVLCGLATIRSGWTDHFWASLIRSRAAIVRYSVRTAVRQEREAAGCRDQQNLERMSGDFNASVARGERAGRCHAGAVQRIDAALYELDQLREELAGVLRSGTPALFPAKDTAPAMPVADTFSVRVDRAAALRSAA